MITGVDIAILSDRGEFFLERKGKGKLKR